MTGILNGRRNVRRIMEFFGKRTDDGTPAVLSNTCPFIEATCKKTIDGAAAGVCAVSNGSSDEPVIICPYRMYGNNHQFLHSISEELWPGIPLFVRGDLDDLLANVDNHEECIIALGQGSGREFQVVAEDKTKLSFDWTLVLFKGGLASEIAVAEVQTVDTTGNYRAALTALTTGNPPVESRHGLNWGNVKKRLVNQLLVKGAIGENDPNFRGLYFVIPDVVLRHSFGPLDTLPAFNYVDASILAVRTYSPSVDNDARLVPVRALNLKRSEVAKLYSSANLRTSLISQLSASLGRDPQSRDR